MYRGPATCKGASKPPRPRPLLSAAETVAFPALKQVQLPQAPFTCRKLYGSWQEGSNTVLLNLQIGIAGMAARPVFTKHKELNNDALVKSYVAISGPGVFWEIFSQGLPACAFRTQTGAFWIIGRRSFRALRSLFWFFTRSPILIMGTARFTSGRGRPNNRCFCKSCRKALFFPVGFLAGRATEICVSGLVCWEGNFKGPYHNLLFCKCF